MSRPLDELQWDLIGDLEEFRMSIVNADDGKLPPILRKALAETEALLNTIKSDAFEAMMP